MYMYMWGGGTVKLWNRRCRGLWHKLSRNIIHNRYMWQWQFTIILCLPPSIIVKTDWWKKLLLFFYKWQLQAVKNDCINLVLSKALLLMKFNIILLNNDLKLFYYDKCDMIFFYIKQHIISLHMLFRLCLSYYSLPKVAWYSCTRLLSTRIF